jgi:3-oxoacyl-[acyl-carrier-protein] synthase-3
MAVFNLKGARISGVSACVPKNEVSTMDYEWISEKERQGLIKLTGVEKRRMAKKGIATSDLCMIAADKLLDELKWDRNEIQILIFVSQSHDYPIPATAIILQDRMKLSTTCLAFDINMGCSGYVYGMAAIVSMMTSCNLKKGLLLVGDISTAHISYQDKSAYPLFGDAGTATAIELDSGAKPMFFNMQSDGSGFDSIIIPDGGMRNQISIESFEPKTISEGIIRHNVQLALDGIKIFNFALKEVVPNIQALLSEYLINIEDIEYFIFHQANLLINESIRKKLRIPKEKAPITIDKFGNTSSASIPLTMVSELRNILIKGNHKMLLSGFGVGLSWGSLLIETENLICCELIEI